MNFDEPPRTQDEIEEKKFEQAIALPDDLHDAEGRPISLAVEQSDEAKRTRFVRSAVPSRQQAAPFTDEEITAMARKELEGDLPVDHARFLATLWERDVRIEALRNPRCSACGQPEWHRDHHGQIHNADMRNHLFQKADA